MNTNHMTAQIDEIRHRKVSLCVVRCGSDPLKIANISKSSSCDWDYMIEMCCTIQPDSRQRTTTTLSFPKTSEVNRNNRAAVASEPARSPSEKVPFLQGLGERPLCKRILVSPSGTPGFIPAIHRLGVHSCPPHVFATLGTVLFRISGVARLVKLRLAWPTTGVTNPKKLQWEFSQTPGTSFHTVIVSRFPVAEWIGRRLMEAAS